MTPVEVPAQMSEPQAVPARSVRRATARRASTRRGYARSRQSDSEASIVGFLVNHPRCTIGDLAKGLNLDPEQVATSLSRLTSAGEVDKASHGYSIQQPARQSVGVLSAMAEPAMCPGHTGRPVKRPDQRDRGDA